MDRSEMDGYYYYLYETKSSPFMFSYGPCLVIGCFYPTPKKLTPPSQHFKICLPPSLSPPDCLKVNVYLGGVTFLFCIDLRLLKTVLALVYRQTDEDGQMYRQIT